MISFIAIGKNIGQILDKCLLSIEHFCRNNNINNYEIIYVDSNSCDNSVKIALSHTNLIKVIKEAPNAAKARNAGFTMSTGDILFFIDGDMTLESDFYSAVFDNNCELIYPFCSGDIINTYIDKEGNYENKEAFYFGKPIKSDKYEAVTGGIFIISRELYRSVGGMREYFVKTQDYDFGLRLAKKGIFLLRKSQVIVKHYTISYHSTVRIFYFIRTLYFIYSGLLIRKHITNKYFFKILIRKFNSPILLLLSIIFMSYSVYAILVYFLITFLRILKQNEKNNKILLLVFFIIRDITIILGFLFYYPTTKNNYFS